MSAQWEGGERHASGGIGADTLNGGLGNDTFDYNAASESPAGVSKDVIIDFAGAGAAIGDKIDLTTIDANSSAAGNQAFIWGSSFTAGHLRYVGGVLQGNTDADAAAEFEIQVVGTPALVVGGAWHRYPPIIIMILRRAPSSGEPFRWCERNCAILVNAPQVLCSS